MSAQAVLRQQAPQIGASQESIEEVFHNLLVADRNSHEFVELWDCLDAYLTACLQGAENKK